MEPPTECEPVPSAYDWEAFRANGYKTVDFIADFFQQVDARQMSVQPKVKPGYLAKALPHKGIPEEGADWDTIMEEVKTAIVPGLTHWQHPDFHAFFPAMVSPPAILGDMMANAFNNPGFNWVSCPAATETEMLVMDWLADAFGLDKDYKWSGTGGGVMQTTATEAMIVVMLAAKSDALQKDPNAQLVAYYSDQSHFCVEKAIKVLNVPHARKLTSKAVGEDGNRPIGPADFRTQLEKDIADGLTPFFVSANFGATGVCAVDPIQEIANVAHEFGMWCNIDAAYAGVTALCPEFRNSTVAFNAADSLLINGSKWFSTMFNTNFMFFKQKPSIVKSLNATGVYLDNDKTDSGSVVDMKDYGLGLGRPWRSLKVYTTLRSFGLKGMRVTIRRHIILAKYLTAKLSTNTSLFDVTHQPRFGLVCFTLNRSRTNEDCLKYIQLLNDSDKMFIVHTVVDDRVIIRISLAHPALETKHMDSLFENLVACAQTL